MGSSWPWPLPSLFRCHDVHLASISPSDGSTYEKRETEDKVLEVVIDGKHFQGRNKTVEHFKDSHGHSGGSARSRRIFVWRTRRGQINNDNH